MNNEYQDALRTIQSRLTSLGYRIEDDSPNLVVLHNSSKWKVLVSGERYSHATSLFICDTQSEGNTRKEYAVWILMEAFEKIFDRPHVKPTLEAQLDFLVSDAPLIFTDQPEYNEEYDQLNQTW